MIQFQGVAKGRLSIRPLADCEADVGALARWLSDERVLEFYEGRDNPYDTARVRRKFLTKQERGQTPCIVELDGAPIGYLQFYPIDRATLDKEMGLDPTERVFGIDQFIGEPSLWGQGIGRCMILLILSYLFDREGADRVVLDPVVTNIRAIRCYQACGFERITILPGHEVHEGIARDIQLMGVTPKTVRRQI